MEEIKQKIEELELALNYVCYDATLIPRLQNVWNKLTELQEMVNKTCNKPAVSGSVLKINLHEYGYSCGDGCCYNYGTITTVNKTELPCHNQDAGTILRQVLEHFGYCVEITYSDDVS